MYQQNPLRKFKSKIISFVVAIFFHLFDKALPKSLIEKSMSFGFWWVFYKNIEINISFWFILRGFVF